MRSTNAPRVAHLTSVHSLDDVRINVKECQTLAAAGYDVILIGAGGREASLPSGLTYVQLDQPKSRAARSTILAWRILREAKKRRAVVYHLHDPELLLLAPLLKVGRSSVIYDAHEDLPRQMFAKEWIPQRLRSPLARLVAISFPRLVSRVDAVVAATDGVAHRFRSRPVVTVANYPMLSEFPSAGTLPLTERPPRVAYLGGVTPARGIHTVAEAVSRVTYPGAQFAVAGRVSAEYEEVLRASAGAQRLELLGHLNRDGVSNLLNTSVAGLAVLPPLPQHAVGLPTKMFEYMAAGIAVIVSDFPAWRQIVDKERCGVTVDPTSPSAIAEAIDWVLLHRDEAEKMGARGQQAVRNKYNWASQADNLLKLYARLGAEPRPRRLNGRL